MSKEKWSHPPKSQVGHLGNDTFGGEWTAFGMIPPHLLPRAMMESNGVQ